MMISYFTVEGMSSDKLQRLGLPLSSRDNEQWHRITVSNKNRHPVDCFFPYMQGFATICIGLPCFFGYKTEVFPSQNNPKNLDTSYKMDLDFLDCLGRVKLSIIAKFHRI